MTSRFGEHRRELDEKGLTLIENVRSSQEAEQALGGLGTLIPQYDGRLRYDVKALPEDPRKRTFSKSVKSIPWHIDAPSSDPPARLKRRCARGDESSLRADPANTA